MINQEIKIELFGRVQGVNFRWEIKNFAEKNNLKGYVANKEDGSVLIVAQGEMKLLEDFVNWIRSEPGFVKIEGLSYLWRDKEIEYKEFTVKREKNYFVDKAKGVVNLAKRLVGKKDEGKIPIHVAIIPDGNRRWAKEKGLGASLGHYKAGTYDELENLFKEARRLGSKYMSIWAFSTENWSRDKAEVNAVFDVVLKGVERFRRDAHKNKIRFRHIGRKDRIPKKLLEELNKLEEETKSYSDFNVQLCLDYGGRDEIVRAVNKLLKSGKQEIGEKDISNTLDTEGVPDPDLIIRTSGEKRTSGLMPFQAAYAELYFADVYFPDFDASELRKAIQDYQSRHRRFGGS